MRTKANVTLLGLHPMMQIANAEANVMFEIRGYELLITGAVEFGHSVTSLHPYGRACDYRTNHLPTEQMKKDIVTDLANKLGPAYDVILEKDHIHVEFDPKDGRKI
jgi:hypothetical protein